MPRKKQIEVQQSNNALMEAIGEIRKLSPVALTKSKKDKDIVDIMTFCYGKEYLDLTGSRLNLYMSQKVILKCFYMGSRGNEKLKLNKEEWEWLYENENPEERDGVIYEKNIKEVIAKMLKQEKTNFVFKELILVLGRRGTKTLLASIISAYEVYKLLTINGGDPHGFYGLPDDDEIAVINVALSQQQAGRLFGQIQARLRNGPFFKGRIAKETTSEIRLYTNQDLEKKKKGTILSVPGSILILCGHSNPDTLRGYSTILILFDELAHYDESGKVTGKKFYDALKPSLTHFNDFGDGRLVEISSPDAEDGIFYEVFKNSKKFDHILSFQLPTWCTNPKVSYDHEELSSDRIRNPDSFIVEYGAQWSKSGNYGRYFPEELVNRCVEIGTIKGLSPQVRPERGYNYYMHIDPAKKGGRYVAVLVAKDIYVNSQGKRRVRVKLANVWVWNPEPGVGLLFHEIDREVVNICGRFHPLAVTYDQYNSIHSLQLLKSHGVNCIQTAYNRSFKNKIYQNLREMMAYQPEPELWLYEEPRLILEIKNLKYRPTIRGIQFVVDKNGEINTDDVVDCLAGAAAYASENVRMALPQPVLVRTGWV